MADPEVGLGTMARARRLPATAIRATDPDSIERMSAGIARTYVGDAATGAMPVLVATVRQATRVTPTKYDEEAA